MKALLILILIFIRFLQAQDVRKKGTTQKQQILNQQVIETTSSKGDFWGVVLDGENGEPLPSVKVELVGKNFGTLTDIDGKFQFKDLEPGIYKIKITSTGYQSKEIDQINVNKGEIRLANITLPVQNISTEEVVISTTLDKESEVSSMVKQINSIRLSDIFSLDLILRTSGNLTLGNALNRMPGVTSIEDKTLIIRGMPERYTLFTLNGIPLPITNIERKSFDYNAFPTNSLLSLDMQKSAHASDLVGGVAAKIDLETVGIPDKNQISAGFQLFYNSNSSFKKNNRYETSKNGIGKFLSQPQSFFDIMNSGDLVNQPFGNQRSISISQNTQNSTVPDSYNGLLGRRWNIGIQRRFEKKGTIFGFSVLIDGMNSNEGENKDYTVTGFYNTDLKRTIEIDRSDYKIFTQSQFLNGIASLGVRWKKGEIIARQYIKSNTENSYSQIYGETLIDQSEMEYQKYIYPVRKFYASTLYNSQLDGTHQFGNPNKPLKLEWKLFNNSSKIEIPMNQQESLYWNDSLQNYYFEAPIFDSTNIYNYYFYLTSAIQKENNKGGKFELSLPLKKHKLQFGTWISSVNHKFNAIEAGYFVDSTFSLNPNSLTFDNYTNIHQSSNFGLNGFLLQEYTPIFNNYGGKSFNSAAFIHGEFNISEKFLIVGGLRFEQFTQSIILTDFRSNLSILDTNSVNLLPSLLFRYRPFDKLQFKLKAYSTLTRPDFRDLSLFQYFDNMNSFLWRGNPTLKYTYAKNLDFKTEYFFTGKEVASLNLFYKNIANPIEQYISSSSIEVVQVLSLRNGGKANIYGMELELRKSLSFINLENLLFQGNISLMKSTQYDSLTKTIRKNYGLQGQTNLILNVGMFYTFDKAKFQMGLFFNRIGKLVAIEGTKKDEFPDIYQLSRNNLDLQLIKEFKFIEIKIVLQDLINQPYRRAQLYGDKYVKSRDSIIYSNQRGFRTMLSFSFKI